MAARKINGEPKKESTIQDKKIIESLIGRLNETILKDPSKAKKAALILEQWLNPPSRKK